MSSGTFATFSKFHLNTSKSTNIKVVQFVEGHNFHVDWHFKFLVKNGEKRGQLITAPVHQDMVTFKVWQHYMHNLRGEKHPRAFVKVVEGSEIYNFPIHHFVHFNSIFWSFKCSNRGAVTQGRAGRRHAAPRLPNALCPKTPRALRRPVRAAPCPPVRRGFPCARRSRPLAVLRVKAGVSHRGEGTFSLPTYKTRCGRQSSHTPQAHRPCYAEPHRPVHILPASASPHLP
jgi:hypothetical protein